MLIEIDFQSYIKNLKISFEILSLANKFIRRISPGKVAVSGFNYAEENKSKGSSLINGYLGCSYASQKNLILKNYYPYKFTKCFCEDILHSLILRQKGIKLFKYFDAKVSEKSQGNIVIKSDMLKSLKNLYSEYLIRKFIVEKFELSKTRMNIYYLIFLIRILIRIIR